jgi:putative MATE family efflux protein
LKELTHKELPLFLKYSFLSVLGMLAISSATVVDGYFVGNYVGSNGLAAINIIMPLYSLFFGISLAFGIGGSVMSGKLIARKDERGASIIFTKTITVILSISSLFSLIIYLNMDAILVKIGANEELLPLTISYLKTLMPFFPFLMVGVAINYFIRVDGRPTLSFLALLASALVNMVLDFLFVAKFGWGVHGAALATGTSFLVLLILLLPHFIFKKGKLYITFVWKNGKNILKAALNGSSEFVNEISIGVTTLFFNLAMLKFFGTNGVAAFTIISYWVWIGQMGMFGICDALTPLVSKNYGARNIKRVLKFFTIGVSFVVLIGLFIALLLIFIPKPLATLFLQTSSEDVLSITLEFGKWIWPLFLFNGSSLIISAYFTALQLPKQSAFIALLRSFFFPIIFISTLPSFMGHKGVFLTLGLSEFFTFIIAFLLVERFNRKNLIGVIRGK